MVPFSSWSFVMAVGLWCAVAPSYGSILTKHCLKPQEDYNFILSKYVGKWYEVRRLYDPADPEQEDCVVMNYQAWGKGNYNIMQSYQITAEGEPIYASGAANPQVFEDSKVPRFLERLNTSSNADPDVHVEIFAIDYDQYAIIYSCTALNATHFTESARILSRQLHLDKHEDDVINLYVQALFKRPEHKWRATQQSPDFCKPSLVESMSKHSTANGYPLPTVVGLLAMVLVAKLLH